jgi:hypothetical protein
MNRHIKKISSYAVVGSMGALVIASLTGCGDAPEENKPAEQQASSNAIKKDGAIVTIQEIVDKDTNKTTYKIIEEVPSSTSRVILRDVNGTDRILSQEEIDKLIKEEEKKVENGTSNLTKNPEEVKDSGGLGLAGTIMASMAAGMAGSYLMNKLMNNQNYQQNKRTSYKSPAVYSRSQSSFAKARGTSSQMGSSAKTPSSSSATRRSGFGSSRGTSSRTGFGG